MVAKRTPEGKRIRTAMGGGTAELVTAVAYDGVLGTETFEDDVRIIGYYLRNVAMITDAMTNTDTVIHAYIELSKSGSRADNGFGRLPITYIWNGLFSIGGTYDAFATVMFPEGMGIDVNEGETINLLGFAEYVGAGGNLDLWGEYILFYVER